MTITKNFIQMNIAQDCEGRRYAWEDVDMTYDEAVNKMNPFAPEVREVVKEFDPETFTITVKVLREAR